jgi:hypothetical protein
MHLDNSFNRQYPSAMVDTKPISKRRRIVFAVLDLVTAAGVGILLKIGWTSSTLFLVLAGLLVLLLVASAVGLIVGKKWGRWLARIASFYQLGLLLLLILAVVFGASYLWGLYGSVGTGAALIFIVIAALLIEALGLLPLFKLRALGFCETYSDKWPRWLRWGSVGILVFAVLLALVVQGVVAYPGWEPLSEEQRTALLKTLAAAVEAEPGGEMPAEGEGGDLYVLRLMSGGKALLRVQARGNVDEATQKLAVMIRAGEWDRELKPYVVVDRVVARGGVIQAPLFFALSIVPGLDGLGDEVGGREVVLLPQELINRRMLTRERPIPFVPDFRLGVSRKNAVTNLCRLAGKRGKCPVEGLHRLRTESWVLHGDRAVPLVRGRPPRPEVDRETARQAARAGGDYILQALNQDDRFTYKLDGVSGKTGQGGYSLPRHAGTTWFLVQLYQHTKDDRYLAGAERGLSFLAAKMAPCGDTRRCIPAGAAVTLGTQALPLIAFIEHARVTGSRQWITQIHQLADMVLHMQKPDGDFHHYFNPRTNQPSAGRGFYAQGQAAMALSMAAGLTQDARYQEGAKKAMDFLAGPYWDFFLGGFFFLEEHWTCLAAREAYSVFNDVDHARLCIDIGRFHRHLQHDAGAPFDDYVGGVGFSAFFPPHTTPTASRAEAMVAAYDLALQIEEPADDLKEGIRQAIGFLMHNQFRAEDAYLLNDADLAAGGVIWNYLDPTIRIDTVQHSCSVMLLGAEVL